MKLFVEARETYNQRFRQLHRKIAGLLQARTEVSLITTCVTSLSYWLSAETDAVRLRHARWRKLVTTSRTVDRRIRPGYRCTCPTRTLIRRLYKICGFIENACYEIVYLLEIINCHMFGNLALSASICTGKTIKKIPEKFPKQCMLTAFKFYSSYSWQTYLRNRGVLKWTRNQLLYWINV